MAAQASFYEFTKSYRAPPADSRCGIDAQSYQTCFSLLSQILQTLGELESNDQAQAVIKHSSDQMSRIITDAANAEAISRGKAMLLKKHLIEIVKYVEIDLKQLADPREARVRQIVRGLKSQVESLFYILPAADMGEDTAKEGMEYALTRRNTFRESTRPGSRREMTTIPASELQVHRSSGCITRVSQASPMRFPKTARERQSPGLCSSRSCSRGPSPRSASPGLGSAGPSPRSSPRGRSPRSASPTGQDYRRMPSPGALPSNFPKASRSMSPLSRTQEEEIEMEDVGSVGSGSSITSQPQSCCRNPSRPLIRGSEEPQECQYCNTCYCTCCKR